MNKLKVSIMALCALAGVLLPAGAQPENAARSWHILKVHNVRPGIVAWWLDAKHNPEPIEMAVSRQAKLKTYANPYTRKPLSGGVFELPEDVEVVTAIPFDLPKGVEIVIGVDSRSELMAFGDTQGLKELENIVAFLDKPLRQIEISAYDVEMDAAAAKTFGMDQPENSPLYFLRQGATENFPAKLDALVAEGKAKILSAPRVTAINNMAASLRITTGTPLSFVSLNFRLDINKPDAATTTEKLSSKANQFYLEESSGFTVEPTINNDDSVTMLLQLGTSRTFRSAPDGAVLRLPSDNLIQSVVNVPDGQTVAIGGLKTRKQETGQTEAQETIRVYFVTARIIKRADEK